MESQLTDIKTSEYITVIFFYICIDFKVVSPNSDVHRHLERVSEEDDVTLLYSLICNVVK